MDGVGLKDELKDILATKMTEDEFWRCARSWYPKMSIIMDAVSMGESSIRRIIHDHKSGVYKSISQKIVLKDCYYIGGEITKGGGVSYFYYPEGRSIIIMGFDDFNQLTFWIDGTIKLLMSIDSTNDPVYRGLISLEKNEAIKISPLNRQTCLECGESVAPGSGKFIDRVLSLDDDQQKMDNNHPYWWGDFTCHECDYKIRGGN